MAKRFFNLWLSALFLAAPPLALADSAHVTLSPTAQTVTQGHVPHFIVSITAGDAPLRVMRMSKRPDLRDNYAKIRVTQAGTDVSHPRDKPITVSIAISDPGPINESDYVVLAPGQTTAFEHNGEPYQLQDLEPGEYRVRVEVTPEIGKPALRSNTATFRVIGP